jgi:tRNA dimethylallyltransferase
MQIEKPQKYLIVIGGATATGKTALGIVLAKHYATEIVSGDSRQFFRQMTIGTAKPTAQELATVPHHLIDHLSVEQSYSVGDFERDALAVLDQIFQRHNIALLVGGSGLYLRAVCEGLDEFPEVPDAVRTVVAEGEQKGGIQWLQQEVLLRDPDWAKEGDMQNPARMRRVLEVCLTAEAPYSGFLGKERPVRNFKPIYIQLSMPRPQLYDRINHRVDLMVNAGLEEEARALLAWKEKPVLRTVGYEEWWPYFDGATDKASVVGKIKQHSRNYAKRQETWFKKYGEWAVFNPLQAAQIFNFVENSMHP